MTTPDPTLPRRAVLTSTGVLAALAVLPRSGPASAATAAARPWTIPALREWTPRSGGFVVDTPTSVVIRPADADRLTRTAHLFAGDLRALTGAGASVVVRSGPPRPGEIHLRLGAADPELGQEGYRLAVGAAAVVTANAVGGVFYGSRSMLQLVGQSPTVPAGVARDWPRYPERGLLLDIGRKHLSREWIAERIRDMGHLKLNVLHLHFTDDLGWRIESERDPSLHSEEHLTKAEVRTLIALAAGHQITVLPEIEMPGHMGAALRNHPELQLRDPAGRATVNKLDFTIPAARLFARDLVEEYVPLFPGASFHMGGDEYLNPVEYAVHPQLQAYARATHGASANAKDGTFGFNNEINALIRSHGRTARIWADGMGGGSTVSVDRDVVAEWWTDFTPLSDVHGIPTPQALLDAGYTIHNSAWYPTYYSNLAPPSPPRPEPRPMYELWAAHRFRGATYADENIGGPWYEVAADTSRNLGSKLSVWNDDPTMETEQETADGIYERMRIMAQKTWESEPLVPTYAEFVTVIDRVGRPPR